jgi:hypothetical protein
MNTAILILLVINLFLTFLALGSTAANNQILQRLNSLDRFYSRN